jgi:hypothetical protein
MTSRNAPSTESTLPKWFYGVIVLIALLIACVLLLANGQIRYMEAYIQCGWQRPILADTGFQIGGGNNKDMHYTLPEEGYHIPKAVDVIGSSTYYCSESDAIADGYTHE